MCLNAEIIFRVSLISLLLVVLFIQIYHGRKGQKPGRGSYSLDKTALNREGALSLIGHGAVLAFMLVMMVLYAVTPKRVQWSRVAFPEALQWLGLGLGIISLAALAGVHRALGRYWSPYLRLQEGHRLVTSGLYRWVRHPMYSVLFVHTLAMALVSSNWLFALLCLARMAFLYARIGKEEAMLIEQFADEYRDYMQQAGRLLPRFKGRR